MRIEGLRRHRGRGVMFGDLPLPVNRWAYNRWDQLCRKLHAQGRLTTATRALAVATVRSALTRLRDSNWGRRMLAKLGGYAVQRKYRQEGRSGARHPAHYAAQVSAARRRQRKLKQAGELETKRLGVPVRMKIDPLTKVPVRVRA